MTQDINLVYVMHVGEKLRLFPEETGLTAISSDQSVIGISPTGELEATGEGKAELIIEGGSPGNLTVTVVPVGKTAPPVRSARPRIRFDANTLTSQRAFFQEALNDPSHSLHADANQFIATAEEFAAEETFELEFDIQGEIRIYRGPMPFTQPGPLEQPRSFRDYPFWTQLSRRLETRLVTLSAAWVLTQEQRFGDVARTQLLSLCAWQKWHEYDIATNNLSLPHITNGVATAYDELFDILSEEERTMVEHALVRLGIRPMTFWYQSRYDHNINVLMNSGTLIGFLAIADRVPGLDMHFHGAKESLLWYLDQRLTSRESEGHTYVCYAMSYIFRSGTALAASCGDTSLLDHPFSATDLPDFLAYFSAAASGLAPLADSYTYTDPSDIAIMQLRQGSDPRFEWLLGRRDFSASSTLPYIASQDQIKTAASPELPPSRLFEKIGWAALRDDWSPTGTFLTFTASQSTAGHNHYDQNNIVLNTGDEWLLTDPGYQVYTKGAAADFTLGTIGHNCLLVNGTGQSIKGGGSILNHEFGAEVDYIAGDATASYEGRIGQWHRHVVLQRQRYILVVDDVLAIDPNDALELRFHTLGQIEEINNPHSSPEIGNVSNYRFQGERAAISLEFASPESFATSTDMHPGAETYGPWVAITAAGIARFRLVTLIVPSSTTEPTKIARVTTSDSSISVAVSHGASEYTHEFSLGANSTHHVDTTESTPSGGAND